MLRMAQLLMYWGVSNHIHQYKKSIYATSTKAIVIAAPVFGISNDWLCTRQLDGSAVDV